MKKLTEAEAKLMNTEHIKSNHMCVVVCVRAFEQCTYNKFNVLFIFSLSLSFLYIMLIMSCHVIVVVVVVVPSR